MNTLGLWQHRWQHEAQCNCRYCKLFFWNSWCTQWRMWGVKQKNLTFGIWRLWTLRARRVLQSLIRAKIMLEKQGGKVLIQNCQSANRQYYQTGSVLTAARRQPVILCQCVCSADAPTCTNKWRSRAGGNPVWSWPPSCGTWADLGCGSQLGQTRPCFPSEPSHACRDGKSIHQGASLHHKPCPLTYS